MVLSFPLFVVRYSLALYLCPSVRLGKEGARGFAGNRLHDRSAAKGENSGGSPLLGTSRAKPYGSHSAASAAGSRV